MSDTGNGGCLEAIGGIVAAIALSAVEGLLLARLWLWFVVPLGAPAIGAAHAYGLATIFSVARGRSKKADEDVFEMVALYALFLAIMFGVGYVTHRVMVA